MDSDATSCADFGRMILSKKERILGIWRHEVRKIFGPEINEWLLENKIPVLLGVVAEALGYTPPSKQATEGQTARSEEHGIQRADQGFNAEQVTREFHMLSRAIREACAEENSLLEEVIEQLKPLANTKNVALSNRVDVAEELAAALGALQRVLMNLTSNALRYTRDGEISIASSQKGGDIEVVVQDAGRGILPEKLARIFEAGEKESGSPGMGFGLAIAKYLVELQGGRIRIESIVDKGTAVIFTLPRVPR